MKPAQIITVIASIAALVSCNKEQKAIHNHDAAPVHNSITSKTIKPNGPLTADKLINDFIERRKKIEAALPSLTKEQANALYESYYNENEKKLIVLDSLEHNVLENYYRYYQAYDGSTVAPPDSIQKKEARLAKAGLHFWELGEGYVEITTVYNFYLELFNGYVTADYQRYLEITAEDNKELYSADAGIIIPFKAVGNRMLAWENYIAAYPKSNLLARAKEFYKMYQADYLVGQDNTPTIDDQSAELYPENRAELNSFLAAHPDSPTTRLIKIVLNYKGSDNELFAIIENEQKAMGL